MGIDYIRLSVYNYIDNSINIWNLLFSYKRHRDETMQ